MSPPRGVRRATTASPALGAKLGTPRQPRDRARSAQFTNVRECSLTGHEGPERFINGHASRSSKLVMRVRFQESIVVELLTEQHNYAVVRLPDRKFPGIAFKGDSLEELMESLRALRAGLESGDKATTVDLDVVLARLEEVQKHYEVALRRHGIPIPYTKT
jgi:predicted RNase H-like HicB family nuclease